MWSSSSEEAFATTLLVGETAQPTDQRQTAVVGRLHGDRRDTKPGFKTETARLQVTADMIHVSLSLTHSLARSSHLPALLLFSVFFLFQFFPLFRASVMDL